MTGTAQIADRLLHPSTHSCPSVRNDIYFIKFVRKLIIYLMNMNSPLKYPKEHFIAEMVFSASRSSGPGGQHVNKVNTKVELRFSVENTSLLSEDDKVLLLHKISNKINSRGELIIVSDKYRSQLRNKQFVIEKFFKLIITALIPPKKRIPIKLSEAKKKKRLENKKMHSDKKEMRKTPDIE